jgi:hypothetical protein
MKKLALAAAAATLIASPAFAGTLDEVVKNGVSMDVGGMVIDVTYKPDGTFAAGDFMGKYKVDGTKLCLTIDGVIDNQCTEYPVGKVPGDTFEVPSDFGPMKITINKPKA